MGNFARLDRQKQVALKFQTVSCSAICHFAGLNVVWRLMVHCDFQPHVWRIVGKSDYKDDKGVVHGVI